MTSRDNTTHSATTRTGPSVWLIGAGGMSVDYAKVLRSMGANMIVIGRGAASAERFSTATGLNVVAGGLTAFLATRPAAPQHAIVSVGVEALGSTVRELLEYGVTEILVEKPGSIDAEELRQLVSLARTKGARVIVAYNRRFYASTLHALKMIADDGGLQSLQFEFTEWGHEIRTLEKAAGVKDAWFLANSTHVTDLAFHLAGTPTELSAFTAGSLDWHPAAAVFVGAGVTDRGVLFSYHANWDAPGRWGLEALTSNFRLIFRPMEALQVMRKGSVKIEPVEIDDRLDKEFKPGLHEQVRRFLSRETTGMCDLAEQLSRWDLYAQMAGYRSIES
ncbi:gfo/Idh/MocA family oxidoreductase [bacterium]|nr:gfo/Idh/MocA family oxidoreductase [bacterium]